MVDRDQLSGWECLAGMELPEASFLVVLIGGISLVS